MKKFIAKYADKVEGVLCGFDRLVFRGELRALYIANGGGIQRYLSSNNVLIKDFGKHVEEVSARLKKASMAAAQELGRQVKYLWSPAANKEAVAREIALKEKIDNGLVCVLTSVEPCMSFQVVPNRETKHLDIKLEQRKCLHLYHYFIHPQFGFMNARIQTWFPFRIQICMNGREWLARQMDECGLKYLRQDNCSPWIADFGKAQELMDSQLSTNWPEALQQIAGQLNPIHGEIFEHYRVQYYWTTHQSEWAVDVRFRQAEDLRRLFPIWIEQGIATFGSPDVLRFLGKRTRFSGQVPENYSGEVLSNVKRREEGARIKHYLNGNSIKGYDKAYTDIGSIFRVEPTFNNEEDVQVYRPKEGDPDGPLSWRKMRRGVADLHRRAEVSQNAAERYLDALASLDDNTRLEELTQKLEHPTQWNGKRVRALRVFGEDTPLLAAVSDGAFTLNGFRNRDLQPLLYQTPAATPQQSRQRSAAVTRKLRMLRAHGLIKKVQHTHRYLLTDSGRKAITAILAARHATVAQLTKAA